MLNPPPTSELLSELEAFRHSVAGLLATDEVDWLWRPTTGEWSLTEIICHLRDVEREVHLPRFRAVLRENQPFIPGVNADEWAGPRHYQEQSGPDALRSYLIARSETVRFLEQLDEADWQRQGQHAFFGQTTLQELVFLAVQHDQNHRKQLIQLQAKEER